MRRLARPTTLVRELVKTDARLIVPVCEPGVMRRVTLLVPGGGEIFAALDVVLIDSETASGDQLPPNAVNPDRFQFEASPLPTNREIPFELQPHQTIHMMVLAGTATVGVLTTYYHEGS